MNNDREEGAQLRAFLESDPAGPAAARGNRAVLAAFEAGQAEVPPALRERVFGRLTRRLPARRGWLLVPVAAAALFLLRGGPAPVLEYSPDEMAYYNYPQLDDDAATALLGKSLGITPDCPQGACYLEGL